MASGGYDWCVQSVWLLLILLPWAVAALGLFFRKRWHHLSRTPQRPKLFTPTASILLLLAMLIVGIIGKDAAANLFQLSAQTASSLSANAVLMLGVFAGQGIVLGVYVWAVLQARSPQPDRRLSPAKAVAMGVGALLLFLPIASLTSMIVSALAEVIRDEAIDPISHSLLALLTESQVDVWFIVVVLLAVFAAPIFEEVMYRGLLQEALSRVGLSRWPAIAVTSGIFAFMHITAVEPWILLVLFVLSLGFGWAYERSGRLVTPIVMHMLFNAANIIAATAVAPQ